MTARAFLWAAVKYTAAAVVCLALGLIMAIAAIMPEPRYIDGVSPVEAWLAIFTNDCLLTSSKRARVSRPL